MRLLRNKSRGPVGIDVGEKAIKAVQFSGTDGARRVTAAASVPRLEPGPTLSAVELHRLADVLDRHGFTGDEAVLAVPADKLASGPLELPPRSSAIAIGPMIRNEFCRAQKLEPHAVELAHWDLPAPARAARGTHVMVAACPHDLAGQWVESFAAIGWDVIALDVRSLALARGCAAARDPAAGLTAIIDLGWSAASLVVLHGNVVVFDRMFAESGLSKLHDAFGIQLRMSRELAHALLSNQHAQGDDAEDLKSEVRTAIRAHLEALAAEVAASVEYATKRYPDATLGKSLLVGGGAGLPDAIGILGDALGVECALATPLSGASCPAALVRRCGPALTLAAGLARYTDD